MKWPYTCSQCGGFVNVGNSTLTACTCYGRVRCNDCGNYGHSRCSVGEQLAPEYNPCIELGTE